MEAVVNALIYITAYDKLPIDLRNHAMRIKYEDAVGLVQSQSRIRKDMEEKVEKVFEG